MKKWIFVMMAMLAMSAAAEIEYDNTTPFDGTLPEGFNYPGERTISDMVALIDYLLDPYPIIPEWEPAMDMNLDGDINLQDVTWLQDYLLGDRHDDWWQEE
jgi:hypothetical protein